MFIAIAGAGALGCRFGVMLQKAGQEVLLLDSWEEHLTLIQREGLTVSGDLAEKVALPIMRPQEATRVPDLVIVLTKSHQLRQMLTTIQPILGPETRVLCLLNGLGHAETLAEFVAPNRILMGVTIWTAQLNGPGHVHLKGSGHLTIQALSDEDRAFGEEVTNLFNQAELKASYTSDVVEAIWKKAMINGSVNATCALLDCTLGQLLESPTGMTIVRGILSEFVAVANQEGMAFELEDVLTFVISVISSFKHHYPSMHQDLLQHQRLTEIDYLNGLIAKKSQALNLTAPYCQLITQFIHAKEEINQNVKE